MVLTLLYAGVMPCLPVPHSNEVAMLYPWWGKPIGIGNVYLHEIVFLAWIALYGRNFLVRVLLNPGFPARKTAILLVVLAIWCGLVSLTAPLFMLDIGRTLRLLVNCLMLFAVVRWTVQSNNLPIVTLIFGSLIGTMINVYLSLSYPLVVHEMFRMSGQNTPGVMMGIAVHLTAWLFLHADRFSHRMFALIAAVFFSVTCAFSYSRIGWFALGTGLIVWAYALLFATSLNLPHIRSLRKFRLYLVPAIVFLLAIATVSPVTQSGLEKLYSLIELKISQQGSSNSVRWAYVVGSSEILQENPFGVGYSGFYDAMRGTEIYRSGKAADEESIEDANPHATFLWYATAGGVPGLFLNVILFIMFMNNIKSGLRSAFSKPGRVFFILLAPVYLLIASSVPYLFNSLVLVVPTAFALGWGLRARAQSQSPPPALALK
ncbi:O-antigen ligase family protein [Thalassospira indica]|nr:O-antigen ligase family protein [Thalassospira indica]